MGDLKISSALKVLPGAAFEVAAGKSIKVQNDGSLNAVGNANARIVFSGMERVSGYWKGILFWSKNVANVLDFTEISYRGSEDLSPIKKKLNVGVVYDSNVSITNSNNR